MRRGFFPIPINESRLLRIAMGTVYFVCTYIHNELSTLTALSPENREGLHGRVSHAYQ